MSIRKFSANLYQGQGHRFLTLGSLMFVAVLFTAHAVHADPLVTGYITSIAGYGTLQNSSDYGIAAPADKLAEVNRSSPVNTSVPDPGSEAPGAVALPAVADEGDPAAVAQAKVDLVTAMKADSAIMEGSVAPGPAALVGLVVAAYAPSSVPAQVADAQSAWTAQLADPSYTPYTGHDFTVDQWQGVVATGSTAFALLTGHKSYLVGGTWSADDSEQHQVHLALDSSGHYKLVAMVRIKVPCDTAGGCENGVSDGPPPLPNIPTAPCVPYPYVCLPSP
jgi:hypothetical protein